jgi:flagellar biosynthesis protein FlhA
VHVRDNLELPPGQYGCSLHGVPIATGDLHPERELALDRAACFGPLDGLPGKDPAFGLDAVWILPSQRAHSRIAWLHRGRCRDGGGHAFVAPGARTRIRTARPRRSPAAAGQRRQADTQARRGFDAPSCCRCRSVVRVLQSLLAERVPLRQMRQIVEALLDHAAHTQDPATLTARCAPRWAASSSRNSTA